MWTSLTDESRPGASRRDIRRDGAPIAFAEALTRWQDDADFRSFFIDLLAAAPFESFRWETPGVTAATANRPFEFVLLDAPELLRPANPAPFAAHFRGERTNEVVEFANLGNDAVMVVPCPVGAPSAYGHLAAFVRQAPEAQKHSLWRCVGSAMARRLGKSPVWLSTAGAGVSWLHVRLDDRPKYYGHQPYRTLT